MSLCKYLLLTGIIFFFLLTESAVLAKNPLSGYFSRLLDETKAEIAIGMMLITQLEAEIPGKLLPSNDSELEALLLKIAASSPRPAIPYRICVIDSPMPVDIALPGGSIVITSGLQKLLNDERQKAFILARNVMHIAMRRPMKLMKKEGLYARALSVIKRPAERRDPRVIRAVLRDYMKIAIGMDQMTADQEAVRLLGNTEGARHAARELLECLSEMVWPIISWISDDIPARIKALETSSR